MKYLAVCLLFAVCYAAVPTSEETCHVGRRKCALNCRSVVLCPSEYNPKYADCTQQSANKYPYCDPVSATCVATDNCHAYPETHCDLLREGRYPELLDCTRYFDCDENHVKNHYICSDNEKYNPVSGFCEATAPCRSFSDSDLCFGKHLSFVAHPDSKKLYVYCDVPPELFSCGEGLANFYEYHFNVETTNCDFICLAVGKYPDEYQDKDWTWYWQCDAQLKATEHQCPSGFYFQPDPTGGNGECVANLRNL